MIQHIVLFRFRDSLDQSDIQQVADHLLNMGKKISQIKDCKWITNFHDRGHDYGFKYGISVEFANKQELAEYAQHPHHREVCEQYLFPALEGGVDGLLVFDHEIK